MPNAFRLVTLMCLIVSAGHAPAAERLRMNEVQLLGSHNSYKRAIDPVALWLLRFLNPAAAVSLDYEHIPLDAQLDLGLRKLELDIFHDPEGGRFASPMGASLPTASAFDPGERMQLAGFKTLHVQDIDFRTHCLLFTDCLATIRNWSDENPGHFPLLIAINAKTGIIDQPGFVDPLPFDAAAWDALDAEIRSVLGDRLFVPDDLRGDRNTLREAALAGWPMIDDVRGRVLFVLDDSPEKKRSYADGHPSLRGRAMFVDADESQPEAAIRIVNDPIGDEEKIRALVEQGFIVRTRSDADTQEARDGDYGRLIAALRSGAQIISTDYYLPEPEFGHDFHVSLPDGSAVRCNPVLKPEGCVIAP